MFPKGVSPGGRAESLTGVQFVDLSEEALDAVPHLLPLGLEAANLLRETVGFGADLRRFGARLGGFGGGYLLFLA